MGYYLGACFDHIEVLLYAPLLRRHPPSPTPRKPRKFYYSRGLYLEIAPRGSKAWRFKYRFADREKRISLGFYPEVSLKLARQLLAHDIDSSAYRMAQKKSKRQWAREWLAKYSPNWTNGHADRTRRELKKCLSLDRSASDCRYHSTGPVGRGAEDRGTRPAAYGSRHTSDVWTCVSYAVATGRAERDVSWDLRGALPPAKVSHFAAITKSKQVGPLLRVLDGYRGTLPVRCALRLAPLVFVRPGELR